MQDTRQRILDAALDLFSQSGYAVVSIRDICARVQVREGTLYYHFSNKQAIAEELFREFSQRADELMAPLEAALGELDRAPGAAVLRAPPFARAEVAVRRCAHARKPGALPRRGTGAHSAIL